MIETLLPALAAQAPAAEEAARPDFQTFIFWAYGLACLFLFVYMAWLITHSRRVGDRLRYLEERFRKAHPGVGEPSQGES